MRISDWNSDVCSSDLGAPEVEPPATPPLPLAPAEAVAHAARQAVGQLVHTLQLLSRHQVAEVGLRQRFGARSAFAPAAPVGRVADTFLAFAGDTVRRAEGAARRPPLRQPAGTLGLRPTGRPHVWT